MNSKTSSHRRAGFNPASVLLAIAALLGTAGAVSPLAGAQESGPPQRAVRLSYVDGKVAISQENQVVTDQAVANSPLLQGMTLTTADDGRAEVQFEDGSVARISPDSSLTLRVLEGQGPASQTEIDLDKGLGYFELQGNDQAGPISIRFGDAVVTGSGFTILRIKNDMPPGDVAVFSGNAHLERSSGLALDIHEGEEAALSNTDNGYNLAENIEQDSWDAWNSDRDQALNAEQAAETAAPGEVTGGQDNNPAWSDLDANGTWYNVPDQGYVWSPYDASDASFDPYGNGSWVWTPGFGYTWASAYSWGYLPYQCGSWNYYNGFGWGWAPGLGGCTPWWGAGYYAGPAIGFAPQWYHRVERPRVPHDRWRPGHPVPVIGVHRRPEVFTAGLPRRDRDTPVAINGRTVMSMRTMPARSTFGRAAFGARGGSSGHMPAQGAARGSEGASGSVGVRTMPGQRNGYPPQRPGYTPGQAGGGGYRGGQPGNRGEQPGARGAQPGGNAGQPAPRNEQPGWNSRPAPTPRTYTPPPAQNAPQAPRNEQPGWNSRPAPTPRTYSPPPAQNAPQAPRNEQPGWNSRPAPTPRTYSPPPAQNAPQAPRNEQPGWNSRPAPTPRTYSPPPAQNAPPAPHTYSPPPPRGGGGFSSGGGGSHGGGAPSGGGGSHGGGAPAGGGGHSGGAPSGGGGSHGGGNGGNAGSGGHH